MLDHKRLRAFELADQLVFEVYKATKQFPREELFGLTSQLRRAAVSISSNIVEGCGRSTKAEYTRFLDISYGSAREVEYQLSIAFRLGYLSDSEYHSLANQSLETCRVLNGLIQSLRNSH